MKKTIGIAIIIIVMVITGGFAYAYAQQSEDQQSTSQNIPDGATGVTFQNTGDSWKHVVVALDNVPKSDGTTGNVYADMWIKPDGSASIDLSGIAGFGNQPLPDGTDMSITTYTDPNVPETQLPQDVADNPVTTTTDPSQGGNMLSAITPEGASDATVSTPISTVEADPTIVTPGNTIVVNGASISINTGGRVFVIANAATSPLCVVATAGGTSAQAPISGPVVASTPRITIVLPL